MPTCPSCGSTCLGEGDAVCLVCGTRVDSEAQIASWLDAPDTTPGRQPDGPESVCTACGYAGDMIVGPGTTCPACLVVIPPRRTESTRVVRVVECPECGQGIGLTREDAGKTVVCPGCSCFLGTFAVGGTR